MQYYLRRLFISNSSICQQQTTKMLCSFWTSTEVTEYLMTLFRPLEVSGSIQDGALVVILLMIFTPHHSAWTLKLLVP